MRFLYVAPRYHTNQVPIMRGLKRKGHEICFISQYAGRVEDYSEVTPVIVGYSFFYRVLDACYIKLMEKIDKRAKDRNIKCGFPPVFKLEKVIKESNADVAILRERSVYSVFANLLCKKYGIPTILYNQSPLWEDRIKNDIPHKIMRKLTPGVRMTPVMGIKKEGKVIENGAAFIPFVMEAEMKPEERQWYRDGIIHIFSIGKYEQRKNHQMLVEVIEDLSREYPIHLTIAGECSTVAHKEYHRNLQMYMKEHGLNDKVTLLQNLNREQIGKEYRKADLFIIPSTLEPASISQLEAMAYSLPVICGDKNGTACYVENNENGWQFKDNNKEALKEAIIKIISDAEQMKSMGKKSYEFICKKYQIETYIAGIEELLECEKRKNGKNR